MTSLPAVSTSLRRLAPATLLALSALSFGVVEESATACAQPGLWDEAGYQTCAEGYEAQREDDYISWYYGVRQCCFSFGGVWREQQPGQAPRCDPPAPSVHVPPVDIRETFSPAPPRPPVRNPGAVIDTFTPAPASPG